MAYFIPIMRYVGGEDYEVVDREVRPVDATPEQIRAFLREGSDDADIFMLRCLKGRAFLNERARMEREARREERHMMLHLNRKGA